MFRCREVADRVDRMIDGELGTWSRLNVRLHLAICRGCRAFVEQMRITAEVTRRAGETEDLTLSDDIKAALAQRQMRSGRTT